MKIKVYQIDQQKDEKNLLFENYEGMMRLAGGIDPGIYKTVFDGHIDAENLRDIYTALNWEPPVGYNGHQMSVSDIVELEDGTCHFCDSVGFKHLPDFDTSKVAPIIGHRMLVLEPHKAPYEMVIPEGLEALQQAVGGYIECTYPLDDNAFVISNDESKLIGLEGNRRINGSIYAGVMLIAADDGQGGTTDLTDRQIAAYTQRFREPEDISPEEVQTDMGMLFIGFN